jgi:hypothetical protein
MATIQIKRGTTAQIAGITLALGEMAMATDTTPPRLWIGTAGGNQIVGEVLKGAVSSNILLNSTNNTSVVTFTPGVQGNYMVGIYFRVVTAQTNLILSITYTDDGGAQTNIVLNNQACPVGQYSCIPVFINAKTNAITVVATAATANQVYVSASIREM